MKYPFFASFIVLCLLLMYEIHKRRNLEAKVYQDFLDEEAKANSTRRKNLDNLDYISIPNSILEINVLNDNEQIIEYKNLLKDLSLKKIVNFTGLTNTELKLKYGAPNIDLLISYDQTYTVLVRCLNDYGLALYNNNFLDEAKEILEFAVSTITDVSATYDTLAQIYKKNGQIEKIRELIPVATKINSLNNQKIINNLKTYLEE